MKMRHLIHLKKLFDFERKRGSQNMSSIRPDSSPPPQPPPTPPASPQGIVIPVERLYNIGISFTILMLMLVMTIYMLKGCGRWLGYKFNSRVVEKKKK
jgi:hypothetical protein